MSAEDEGLEETGWGGLMKGWRKNKKHIKEKLTLSGPETGEL